MIANQAKIYRHQRGPSLRLSPELALQNGRVSAGQFSRTVHPIDKRCASIDASVSEMARDFARASGDTSSHHRVRNLSIEDFLAGIPASDGSLRQDDSQFRRSVYEVSARAFAGQIHGDSTQASFLPRLVESELSGIELQFSTEVYRDRDLAKQLYGYEFRQLDRTFGHSVFFDSGYLPADSNRRACEMPTRTLSIRVPPLSILLNMIYYASEYPIRPVLLNKAEYDNLTTEHFINYHLQAEAETPILLESARELTFENHLEKTEKMHGLSALIIELNRLQAMGSVSSADRVRFANVYRSVLANPRLQEALTKPEIKSFLRHMALMSEDYVTFHRRQQASTSRFYQRRESSLKTIRLSAEERERLKEEIKLFRLFERLFWETYAGFGARRLVA